MHMTTLVTNLTRGMMTIFDSTSTIILVIVLTVGGTFINVSIMIVCIVIWFRNCRNGQLNSISSMVAQSRNQGIILLQN